MISYAAVSRSTKLLSNVGCIVKCVHWPKQDGPARACVQMEEWCICECSQN